MRQTSMKSLWLSIKELFRTVYQALLDDQEKMDKLKEEHMKAKEDEEEILGI
jgi:hypothetical protein